MKQIDSLFKPLIGELAWSVRRGHGSFLTLEFGMPHLLIREPIATSKASSARVKRGLKRRGVFVTGDWHLWVQYGSWQLTTPDGILGNCDTPGSPLDECINDLDGQKFVCVSRGSRPDSCAFHFDLGGVLEVWPSSEIRDDQWSLHSWNGDIVTCRNNGALVFAKADLDPGIFKRLAPT